MEERPDSKHRLLFVVSLIIIYPLTGCTRYPYSGIENEVHSYVNRFSKRIPKGFVRSEKQADDFKTIVYRDKSLAIDFGSAEQSIAAGKGRIIWTKFFSEGDEFIAGFFDADALNKVQVEGGVDPAKLEKNAFIMFSASYDYSESPDINQIILAKPKGLIEYARGPGSGKWKRKKFTDIGIFFDKNTLYRECVNNCDEEVRAGQVRRYVELATAIGKTYYEEQVEALKGKTQ